MFGWCVAEGGADGSFPVDQAATINGKKLLRDVILDNRSKLYKRHVKLSNLALFSASVQILLPFQLTMIWFLYD